MCIPSSCRIRLASRLVRAFRARTRVLGQISSETNQGLMGGDRTWGLLLTSHTVRASTMKSLRGSSNHGLSWPFHCALQLPALPCPCKGAYPRWVLTFLLQLRNEAKRNEAKRTTWGSAKQRKLPLPASSRQEARSRPSLALLPPLPSNGRNLFP